MNSKLNIIVCSSYLKEAQYVIESEGLNNIEIIQYPANCRNCITCNENKIKEIIKEIELKEEDTLGLNKSLSVNCCQALVGGKNLVKTYMEQGYYIVTPGWLMNWKEYVIDLWGFNSDNSKTFFKEMVKGLILLDSGVFNDTDKAIKAFSQYVSLEYTVIPVGIDHFKANLCNLYLNWQNNKKDVEIKEKTRKIANYTLLMDLIIELNKLVEFDDLMNKTIDIFAMFTGAKKIAYVRMIDDQWDKIQTYGNIPYMGKLKSLDFEASKEDGCIMISNNGFILKLKVDEKTYDYIELDDIPLGERIHEYIHLSKSVFKVCSLIMTKRKEFYEGIKEKIELEEENKGKSILVANISHELRTPVNVILSGVQLFENGLESNTNLDGVNSRLHLKSIKQNCFRLIRLINNLIDITKLDQNFMGIHKRSTNIVSVVEDITLSVAEYAKGKNIKVIFDTEREEIFMYLDLDKLERIFLNLLSNAIKYTKKDGNILVKIYDRGNSVNISVKDSGIGIPDTKVNHIFERFMQVEDTLIKNYEGSGIGLSIVKAFVEMHGGKINVNSKVGVGSEFLVELPIETSCGNPEEDYYPEDRESRLIELLEVEFSDIYFHRE